MKRFLLLILALSLLISLAGCRDGFTIRRDEASEDRSEKTDNMDDEDETEPTITGSAATTTIVEETVAETEPSSSLPELPVDFVFMSGAGAWATTLHINSDGTFDGYFSDSDMGDTGDDYPNGTKYECAFYGKFTDITQVSEFEYSMQFDSINFERSVNSERIEDGVRIISSAAYGMDEPDVFLLYLPGRATADLPTEYLDWVSMPNVWVEGEIPEELPFYGLYNVGGAEGFFRYSPIYCY